MELTNNQTEDAFELENKERSFFDKVFNPISSRKVDPKVRELFLNPNVIDPEADTRDLLTLSKDEAFKEQYDIVQQKRAAARRDRSENSQRNSQYDFFTNKLNLNPKTAENLVATAEWLPLVGSSVAVEDAVDNYKNGNYTEAAFDAAMVSLEFAPVVGKLLRRAIKGEELFPTEELNLIAYPKTDKDPNTLMVSRGPLSGTKVVTKEREGPKVNFDEKVRIDTADLRLRELRSKFFPSDVDTPTGTGINLVQDLRMLSEEKREGYLSGLKNIWKETGIGFNTEYRPFFEIDDSAAKLDTEFLFKKFGYDPKNHTMEGFVQQFDTLAKTPKNPVYLNEVLDHPELFKRYPQMKNIRVTFTTEGTELGSYGRTLKEGMSGKNFSTVALNPTLFRTALQKGDRTPASVILHEVQHSLQDEARLPFIIYEGTEASSRKFDIGELDEKIKKLKTSGKGTTAGLDKKTGHIIVIPPEMQFMKEKSLGSNRIEISRSAALQQLRLKQIELRNKDMHFDDYLKSYTEVEARNVQTRKNFDSVQRRNITPYDTMSSEFGNSGMDIILLDATDPLTGKVNLEVVEKHVREVKAQVKDSVELNPNFNKSQKEAAIKQMTEMALYNKRKVDHWTVKENLDAPSKLASQLEQPSRDFLSELQYKNARLDDANLTVSAHNKTLKDIRAITVPMDMSQVNFDKNISRPSSKATTDGSGFRPIPEKLRESLTKQETMNEIQKENLRKKFAAWVEGTVDNLGKAKSGLMSRKSND